MDQDLSDIRKVFLFVDDEGHLEYYMYRIHGKFASIAPQYPMAWFC
jgi:hypothetical protein